MNFNRPKTFGLLTVLVFVLSLSVYFVGGGTGIAYSAEPTQSSGPWNLTVFHTNDGHSNVFPRPASWRKDKKMVGGIVPLAFHLEQEKKTVAAFVVLDAGDFMTGNPVCQFKENGVQGAAIATLMNKIGYDAGVLGNHEFDTGVDNVKKLVALFNFPILAADIVDQHEQPVFRREPLILERGDLRIGVMGVSACDMNEVVMPSRFNNLHTIPQAELVKDQLAKLIPVTDVQILITHNGLDMDTVLANELAGSGLDVIVGGHSHSRLKQAKLESGILIVQAGSKMTNLGRLDLWVEDGQVVRYNGQLINLWSDNTTASSELTSLVEKYKQQINTMFGKVIGKLEVDWHKSRGENSLGNWICDAMKKRAEVDVAFFNSGGLRKGLSAGPIKALDIHEMLPFANLLVKTEVTGGQLKQIIQQNADASINREHGILQVAGIKYSYRAAADGNSAKVEEILIAGQPLNTGKTYKIALPDYVAMMADVYLKIQMPAMENIDGGITITDMIIEAVKSEGTLVSPTGGRIILLGK